MLWSVFIIGPKQEALDRSVFGILFRQDLMKRADISLDVGISAGISVVKPYNDAADKSGRPGRMYGIEGDVRKKVKSPFLVTPLSLTVC